VIGAAFDDLFADAAGGDAQAFAALWRDLHPAVLRYLLVVAPDAAEDLASETWLDVIRGLGRFRGDEAGFRGWVFTVARHRALDHRRTLRRRPADAVPLETLAGHPADDDPAAAALDALATAAALALIAELPADQAEVVALRVIAGLDVARVAMLVGKRPGAVRVLAHRGLRRLAERLARDVPAARGG
jgi:RNA polymerase sigma-70 factor, ECF subfamily